MLAEVVCQGAAGLPRAFSSIMVNYHISTCVQERKEKEPVVAVVAPEDIAVVHDDDFGLSIMIIFPCH